MSYTPTVWKTGDIVSSTKLNKIETELVALDTDKANIDGYYEGMTVGNAEQLVATVGVEDSVPFNFRTTGGSADVGDRKTMEVVGGTVAFNQQFEVLSATDWVSTDYAKGTATFADGECTYTVVTPGASYSNGIMHRSSRLFGISGHKYFVSVDAKSSRSGVTIGGDVCNKGLYFNGTLDTWYKNFALVFSGTGNQAAYLCTRSGTEVDDIVYFKNFMLIDLTQMFGSTIADYIYSLESATAGAGVAWFRKLFPKPYYAYNAGELMSVKTSEYASTGFNQWDEEWEIGDINGDTGQNQNSTLRLRSKGYIPVEPSTQYFFCIDSAITGITWVRICYYDAEKNFISTYSPNKNNAFTTPNNASFMRFCTPDGWGGVDYTGGICINLHWDGERDGEYEPYETHTYSLDSDLELRGIPKLDADNQLYYDGDIYESDGAVKRRYGIVDLGTLTWVYDPVVPRFYSTNFGKGAESDKIANAICPMYEGTTFDKLYASEKKNMTMNVNTSGTLSIINTSYSTTDAFKTAMSGVYLVYELATPEEETADPYTTPQIVNDFGTEEFVDTRTIPIPVGHNSKYQANLRAKLEMAPNSPSGDGDYIVRQSGGQNTYVPITFPADELPAAPTTDGNYVLKCTVSSGTATFTWEAQT